MLINVLGNCDVRIRLTRLRLSQVKALLVAKSSRRFGLQHVKRHCDWRQGLRYRGGLHGRRFDFLVRTGYGAQFENQVAADLLVDDLPAAARSIGHRLRPETPAMISRRAGLFFEFGVISSTGIQLFQALS